MKVKTAYERVEELRNKYEEANRKVPINNTQHLADLLHSRICDKNHDYPEHANYCDWLDREFYPNDDKVRAEEELTGTARTEFYEKAQRILAEFKFVDAMKFVKLL